MENDTADSERYMLKTVIRDFKTKEIVKIQTPSCLSETRWEIWDGCERLIRFGQHNGFGYLPGVFPEPKKWVGCTEALWSSFVLKLNFLFATRVLDLCPYYKGENFDTWDKTLIDPLESDKDGWKILEKYRFNKAYRLYMRGIPSGEEEEKEIEYEGFLYVKKI